LLPLLQKIAGDLGTEKMPVPHAFDDAAWVGYRLTEIVPVQPLAKQKLLELQDPLSRLEILHTYLAQRKLVV
jgi:Lon protease-like protein